MRYPTCVGVIPLRFPVNVPPVRGRYDTVVPEPDPLLPDPELPPEDDPSPEDDDPPPEDDDPPFVLLGYRVFR